MSMLMVKLTTSSRPLDKMAVWYEHPYYYSPTGDQYDDLLTHPDK